MKGMYYKDRLKEKYVRLKHVRNWRRNIMVDKYLKHVNSRKKKSLCTRLHNYEHVTKKKKQEKKKKKKNSRSNNAVFQ